MKTITTTTPIIDLGNVKAGSTTSYTFNITNNSTHNILLTTGATCGCTKPTLDTNKMGPLEMQFGKGTFKASSTTGAIKNKNITVSDNFSNTVTIKLTGNVI